MKASAWLLTMHGGCCAAVGERELVHIISDEVERVVVPGSPERTNEFIVWQNRRLPLFDVTAALGEHELANDSAAVSVETSGAIIVIAAYQISRESQIKFGAIPVGALPERIEVADDSGCDLPPQSVGWTGLAHSCFRHQRHGAVPILDLSRVFALGHDRCYPFEKSAH
jgi:hypothetical protein